MPNQEILILNPSAKHNTSNRRVVAIGAAGILIAGGFALVGEAQGNGPDVKCSTTVTNPDTGEPILDPITGDPVTSDCPAESTPTVPATTTPESTPTVPATTTPESTTTELTTTTVVSAPPTLPPIVIHLPPTPQTPTPEVGN
jgi:hypothetical protein